MLKKRYERHHGQLDKCLTLSGDLSTGKLNRQKTLKVEENGLLIDLM